MSNALRKLAMRSASFCSATSSRKARLIRNCRPASATSTSPLAPISSRRSLNRPVTWAGSQGAAIVTTARASGTCEAAASTAAPPRLWPMRIAGARPGRRSAFAAATRSATLEEKVVLANSPSLDAEPGEVEAQHGDTERGQAFGDALGGMNVLAAGEAMGEQRIGARLPGRAIEQRCQILSRGIGEIEAFSRHAHLPKTSGHQPFRWPMNDCGRWATLVNSI